MFTRIFLFVLFLFLVVVSVRNIKQFILMFIALKSFICIFYNVKIFIDFNILELLGVVFPFMLMLYWIRSNFRVAPNSFKAVYLALILWVFFSTMLFHTGVGQLQFGKYYFSPFFRIFNGFAVFIVFPIVFRDKKSIDQLINAFFVGTLFPLGQGLIQVVAGQDIFGMASSVTRGETSNYVVYYGLYHKYDGFSWAALAGSLIVLYKLNVSKKKKTWMVFLFLYLALASLTLSRLLAIILFVVYVALLWGVKSKYKILIPVAALVLFTVSGFFQSQYDQFMMRSEREMEVWTGESKIEAGFHGRIGMWMDVLGQFTDRPFVEQLTGTNIMIGPHGDFILWLLTFGIIGFALYTVLMGGLLVEVVRRFRMIKRFASSPRSEFFYLYGFGLMVTTAVVVWIVSAIIHNPSQYPDYSFLIIGGAGILLSIRKSRLRLEILRQYDSVRPGVLTALLGDKWQAAPAESQAGAAPLLPHKR